MRTIHIVVFIFWLLLPFELYSQNSGDVLPRQLAPEDFLRSKMFQSKDPVQYLLRQRVQMGRFGDLRKSPENFHIDPANHRRIRGSEKHNLSKNENIQLSDLEEVWISTYCSDLLGSLGYPTAMVIDDLGYIYVTGVIMEDHEEFEFDESIITMKYSPGGELLWSVEYRENSGYWSISTSIAVDSEGNVYVSGLTVRSIESNADFITLKYDGNGNKQWKVFYAGPGSSFDFAVDIKIGSDGFIYVTGLGNTAPPTYGDFVTVKYDTEGSVKWIAQYSGSTLTYNNDYPIGIIVDDDGNVYVAGKSAEGEFPQLYYMTIVKYNQFGSQLWVRKFANPYGEYIETVDFKTDLSGNLYVLGSVIIGYRGTFILVKYDPQGNKVWDVSYPMSEIGHVHPIAMAIGGDYNVYVTGQYSEWFYSDYMTIKYNSEGEEVWAVRYDHHNELGQEGGSPASISLDETGNVYVTGRIGGLLDFREFLTLKYNSDGTLMWSATTEGGSWLVHDPYEAIVGLAVSRDGDVVITGSRFFADAVLTVVKYNTDGIEMWNRIYAGQMRSEDSAVAMILDHSGNVYILATSRAIGTGYDYSTAKFNSSGVLQWVTRYDGPGIWYDIPTALDVDNQGNVYVTGASQGEASDFDYATVRYSTDGDQQWVMRYSGPGNGSDIPLALKVDNDGYIYVTGGSVGPYDEYDIATVKYTPDGEQLWVRRYSGPVFGPDAGVALGFDSDRNVYVTGFSDGGSSSYDFVTIKYNSSGEEIWVRRFDGPDHLYDEPVALAIDHNNDIIIIGTSIREWRWFDYTTIKYNSDGEILWVRHYDGPNNLMEYPLDLAVDDSGSIYVTGYGMNARGLFDYLTVKYNSSGEQLWDGRYSVNDESWDVASGIGVDNAGNVYVTGSNELSYIRSTVSTIVYSSEGIQKSVYRYYAGSSQYAVGLALDNQGGLYIGGSIGFGFSPRYTSSGYLLMKYNIVVSVDSYVREIPASYRLHQNYPNPFNPSTAIRYEVPATSNVTVQVYSIAGEKVSTLVDKVHLPGYYMVEWHGQSDSGGSAASGLYIYTITAGTFRQSNRMILIR
jgi:uncharacterized delta-60 repeat protein